jgi:hypothetical protein
MNCLVVNCSKQWNLGAAKLANWLKAEGHTVSSSKGDPGFFAVGYDLVCLSVIFSWDAIVAREIALRVKGQSDVWCGGPGMFTLRNWWRSETGLECHAGLDQRFERTRGEYLMNFASRGCPVDCWFCIVPKLEGAEFTLDWDFQPAPVLCDNNLSALPKEFQEHIIQRYRQSGVVLRDANSGFEPRTFTEETYLRWKPILKGPWRFAYDDMAETNEVRQMMRILELEPYGKKRVYVLVGNEPFEQCHERTRKVIEWGGEPFVQPFIPLNSLDKRPSIRHDWTEEKLKDFARYNNRFLWRYMDFSQYKKGYSKSDVSQVQIPLEINN